MAKVVWTAESISWLKEIREYIAADNPTAATKTVSGIYEKVQLLGNYPEIGFSYSINDREDVRVLLYGHYRIAYTYSNDTVHILGIFHAALDIDRYFEE